MSPITVRRMTPDQWLTWREVRLTALAESAEAFGSNLAKELAYDEAAWRDKLDPDRGLKAVAFVGNDPAGIIGAWLPEPGMAELFSMWVSPAWRGRGVGDLLVAEAMDWAPDTAIRLWVVEDNGAARRFYERLGFQPTEQYQPHPNDPAVREVRMVGQP